MYLLDTNILIDISRRKLNAAYELLLNSDVKAELLLGAEKSMQPEEERLKVESLLLPFEIIPFDETCAAHYAKIRADLERKGLTIGGNDYLIAATALARGAVLVTNNVDEFKRVPGLSLECWEEIDF